jgi:hypothetical protein
MEHGAFPFGIGKGTIKFMRRWQDRNIENETKIEKSLFCGLDLGQSQDYSALAIIECVRTITNGKDQIAQLNCVHLQRWQLHTPFPKIVGDVVAMINSLKPSQSPEYKPVLAVDATGCGAAVIDLFKQEKISGELRPILIVGGATVSNENGVFRVPKRDLVSVVQVGLQNRTLKIAETLDLAEVLSRELQNFTVKITDAGNDTYGEWRTGKHDDLVLAVSLALWCANKPPFRVTERERQLFRSLNI